MLKKIKYFVQRGFRGYSDQDLWSFNDYLCEIIAPALRKLAEDKMGCSSDFWDAEVKNNECHKWKEALETMAQGFEAVQEINNMRYYKTINNENGYTTKEIDEEKLKLLTTKYKIGLKIFCDNFTSLWD